MKKIEILIEACLNNNVIKFLSDVHNKKNEVIVKKGTITNDILFLNKIKKEFIALNAEIISIQTNESEIKEKEIDNKQDKEQKNFNAIGSENIEKTIEEIKNGQKIVKTKFFEIKKKMKIVMNTIRKDYGQFDYNTVEKNIDDALDFIKNIDNAFLYLTKQIFSHTTYAYEHSINVFLVGFNVLRKLSENKTSQIPRHLTKEQETQRAEDPEIKYYRKDEIDRIAKGFFLHDIGKTIISEKLLNKPEKLTIKEFKTVAKHSYVDGMKLLRQNDIDDPFIVNCVRYHHAPSYLEEKGYPRNRTPDRIPSYVHICKLADIYSAATAKKCYADAITPIAILTEMFRKYSNNDINNTFKNSLLGFIRTTKIHPVNTVVNLTNGQKGYVINSNGPIIIPFTDANGETIKKIGEPIRIGDTQKENIKIDYNKIIDKPKKIYDCLPKYLKELYATEY